MTNCHWIDSKLEALFTDTFSREDAEQCQTHLASCEDCRRHVESLKNIDTLVRRVFLRRTVIARQAGQFNTRTRVLKITLAAASVAAVVISLGIGLMFFQETPAPPVAIQPPNAPTEPVVDKKINGAEPSNDRKLAKPEDREPAKTASELHLDVAAENAPDFAITDAAGYIESLDSYRGRVLLVAVISSNQKAAIANLQQLYDNFGSKQGILFRGVARHRDDSFKGVTFPVYFNQGSKLLGLQDGEFLLLDKSGKKQLDGSLTDPGNLVKIRSQLGQLSTQ